ncbi:MAG: OsmC family protein [Aeromicrobium sp.]
MDATALRDLQRPLKRMYRDAPMSALVPLRAEGRLVGDGVTCTVEAWPGPTRAGLHPATGGDGRDACSGDMLLEALAACAGVTLRSVATAMGVVLVDARVVVEGHFDARGTLGVDRDVAVGLTDVAITFAFDTDADHDKVARLVVLAERYCVVAQTLRNPPSVTVRHEVNR